MQYTDITLVHHFLEKSAEKYPDKIAVIHDERKITYYSIDNAANNLANFLSKNNFKKGDRICIILKNSIEYIICYFAILKIGGIVVPLNTEATIESLIQILNDCSAKGLICHSMNLEKVQKVITSVPTIRLAICDNKHAGSNTPKHFSEHVLYKIITTDTENIFNEKINNYDIASIIYTSGSTGKPKGVTLTHLNSVTNTKSIITYLELSEKDKVLIVLPFYYCYGKSLLHTHFIVGGTVVIDNRFVYPNLVLETMQREQVTGFSGVPSTFSILLNHSTFAKQNFPHLQYITQAGGAMAPHIIKKLKKILPDKKIFIMYGATEASARLSYLDPEMLEKKLGSIGKAIPGVTLTIVTEDGKKAKVNEIGEIVAQGDNIMLGYWNDPTETNSILKEDGYHTGDLARCDKDGFLFVTGRKRDIIKVAGNRLSAKEIEEILIQLPGIDEVAVIGVDDPILGEAIKAFIVPKDNKKISDETIKNFCLKKLPLYKLPKYYHFLPTLPKNESGKIMKEVLKQQ